MEVKDCFVIMPFSSSKSHSEEEWNEVFEKMFERVWGEFGVDCYRAKVKRGSITKDIIEKLFSASVVFADLTDSNPNVMYELGVRHSFGKPSVMVRKAGSSIPFDVNDYKVFEYKYTPAGMDELKAHIRSAIQDIETYPKKADNPVWDFLSASNFAINYYRNLESIRKLEALVEELVDNLSRCDWFLKSIESITLRRDDSEISPSRVSPEESRELKERTEEFFPHISGEALVLVRITKYVDFREDDWDVLTEINAFYRWCAVCSANIGLFELVETDRNRIIVAREVINNGISVIKKRISELELTE